MPGYRLIIFDLDGTLVDSQYDITDAVNHVRLHYGEPTLEVKAVRSLIGNGVKALMEKALPGRTDDDINSAQEIFSNYYERHLLDKTKVFPRVPELLEHLSGKTKVILSNKPEKLCRALLERLGLCKYFELVWGGDSVVERKPSPEPVLRIMKSLGYCAPETLMVGDGAQDCQAACAAGVDCALCAYGYTERKLLRSLKPNFVLKQPLDLILII